ncbi:MAG: class I SAM-dependent methyltransferase [Verrucomicrobiota bacterium]
MPHWLIKTAIHRTISLLPQRQKWNELFQERVTKSLNLAPGGFEARLDACRRYLDEFLQLSPECEKGFTAVELGTGWYPTVPIGLYLCGATEIWSFDIDPLLRRDRLKVLLNYFLEYDRNGTLPKFLPRLRPERMAQLRQTAAKVDTLTPAELLAELKIHVRIRDARSTELPPQSVDLFFSYSVLEYVPAAIQLELYAEFRRVAKAQAVMIHFINLKDQYCNFDRSLTPLNCLKYSNRAWRWLDSPMIPQTRLRISDYRQLLIKSGFEIKREVNTSAPAEMLQQIKLAPEFQAYAPEDLRVITTWLTTRLVSEVV